MLNPARYLLALVIGCWLAASAPRALAQEPHVPRQRQGYYLQWGLGGSSTRLWQDDGPAQGSTGLAVNFRFGEMLTEHLGLGLRIGNNLASQFSVIGIEGQWEFAPNFALLAGAGLGVAVIDRKGDPDLEQQGTVGAGYTLGLSYDWFVGVPTTSGGFALTPIVEARFVPGDTVRGVSGVIGLSITYFTGLPRDQLALPDREAYRLR